MIRNVVGLSEWDRRRISLACVGLVAIAACGCSAHPTGPGANGPGAPATTAVAPPPRNGVAITGLEAYAPFLVLDDHGPLPTLGIPLTSTRYSDGRGEDCTATARWSSSNTDIVEFGTGSQRSHISPIRLGEAVLSATCGNESGTLLARVDRWRFRGAVVDDSGNPVSHADLSGVPVSGYIARTDGAGQFDIFPDWIEFRISVLHPGFERLEPSLVTWDRRGATMNQNFILRRIPGQLVLDGDLTCERVGSALENPCQITPSGTGQFQVPGDGVLRLDLFERSWADISSLRAEVYCGETLVRTLTATGYGTIEMPAARACDYRLKFSDFQWGSRQPNPFRRFGVVFSR